MPLRLKFNFWSRLGCDSEEIKKELNEVFELKKQLVDIGFEPGEVEYIIHEHAMCKRISQWDSVTVHRIKEALQNQVRVARQCLHLVGSGLNK